MGGSPNQGTQTTTSTPSPAAQNLANSSAALAANYAGMGGLTLPGFSPIAGFTPNQVAGQNMATSMAGPGGALQQLSNNAVGANTFLTTGAALDPSSNPGLAKAITAAQQPVMQNFQESVIPGLRSNATATGNIGSSREGVAEGMATQQLGSTLGNIAGTMENANYQNALDQMTKAMGLTPTVDTAAITPATTMSGVGDVQQALNQSNLGYLWNSKLFPQENLLSTAQALGQIAGSLPGGTTSSTASGSTSPSALQYMLGAGSLGAGLFGSGGLFGSAGLGSLSSLLGMGGGASAGSSIAPYLLAGAML